MGKCTYRDKDGKVCGREAPDFPGPPLCPFHIPRSGSVHGPLSLAGYETNIDMLIARKDGNWRGFLFPAGFKFIGKEFDFDVILRDAEFEDLSIFAGNFRRFVDFSGAIFKGTTIVEGTFASVADFKNCKFLGPFKTSAIYEIEANFTNCRFGDDADFYGSFKLNARFDNASFQGAANFSGSNKITVIIDEFSRAVGFSKLTNLITRLKLASVRDFIWSKFLIRKPKLTRTIPENSLFYGTVELVDVDFGKPQFTRFKNVNLSQASLVGTDFRGVRFYGVSWAKITNEGRRGIYDELNTIKDSKRSSLSFSDVEAVYRNIRLSLEHYHDYQTANDFYAGEMEARRKQKRFIARNLISIEFLYKISSNYGISPFRASLFLFFILSLYAYCNTALMPITETNFLDANSSSFANPLSFMYNYCATVLVRAANILLFRERFDEEGALSQQSVNLIFHIVSIVQVALLIFATRARIKRF